MALLHENVIRSYMVFSCQILTNFSLPPFIGVTLSGIKDKRKRKWRNRARAGKLSALKVSGVSLAVGI